MMIPTYGLYNVQTDFTPTNVLASNLPALNSTNLNYILNNLIPAGGAQLYFPADQYIFNAPITFPASVLGIGFRGVSNGFVNGGPGVLPAQLPASVLIYSTTDSSSFLVASGTLGLSLQDLGIIVGSSSTGGILIDYNSTGGGGLAANALIERCLISGTGGGGNGLIWLNRVDSCTIHQCTIQNGGIGIRGHNRGIYANRVQIIGCLFQNNNIAHIQQGGDAWFIANNRFLPLKGGLPGAYSYTTNTDGSAVSSRAMTWLGNWFGGFTATNAPGSWIRGARFCVGDPGELLRFFGEHDADDSGGVLVLEQHAAQPWSGDQREHV